MFVRWGGSRGGCLHGFLGAHPWRKNGILPYIMVCGFGPHHPDSPAHPRKKRTAHFDVCPISKKISIMLSSNIFMSTTMIYYHYHCIPLLCDSCCLILWPYLLWLSSWHSCLYMFVETLVFIATILLFLGEHQYRHYDILLLIVFDSFLTIAFGVNMLLLLRVCYYWCHCMPPGSQWGRIRLLPVVLLMLSLISLLLLLLLLLLLHYDWHCCRYYFRCQW